MNEQLYSIVITATFTAEPLEEVLVFWMHELDIPSKIAFAPYNQVFQQLLDPTSLLAQNRSGINIILLRMEDWLYPYDRKLDGTAAPVRADLQMERYLREFALALNVAVEHSGVPHLVCVCPNAPHIAADPQLRDSFADMEARLAAEITALSNVYMVTTEDLATTYPVGISWDRYGDALSHIPYTTAFFTALGTMIARKVYALRAAPYKVIVLDCDQTLWAGVCGEDGAHGVSIDAPHLALQRFIVRQQTAGRLICLCSKNNSEDVVEVFTHRQELVLRWDHLTAWRINWRPKSENLRALAEELGLGLDSFIFIDDSPLECAEVRSQCLDVLTIQLRADPSLRVRFLEHVWAFDYLKVTEEDRQRPRLYQQERQREEYRAQSLTLGDFLAGLELDVQFLIPKPSQFDRVAQLTQRTNQFNLTTTRRSVADIRQLCRSGTMECLAVQVRDRFGDYGLVGIMIFEIAAAVLRVDTFLLSCRALGRGVEHRMLARLGAYALERECTHVDLFYVPSAKNQPARNFLESIDASHPEPHDTGFTFRFPATFAAALTYQARDPSPSDMPGAPREHHDRGQIQEGSSIRPPSQPALLLKIASELYDVQQIHAAIEAQQPYNRHPGDGASMAPRTPLEAQLAAIWAHMLRLDRVDVHTNFFASGGDSLLGTRLLLRIREVLQVSLSLDDLFKAPTVGQMSALIEAYQIAQSSEDEIEVWLHELAGLSDDQVHTLLSTRPGCETYGCGGAGSGCDRDSAKP